MDMDEILYVVMDAIAGDVNDPTASIILKWLRFKCVKWMHYLCDSALLNSGWDCWVSMVRAMHS
jgi:hypothetical protein